MRTRHSLRLLQAALRPHCRYPRWHSFPTPDPSRRYFRTFPALQKIEHHVLSDIGEGVKEVQIIQWFVEEGAAVEEWAPLCEVQSDKASVEITSKYSGVVKKLHYDRDAIVQVGDTMLDIEVEGEGETEEPDENTAPESKETEETSKIADSKDEVGAEGGTGPSEQELAREGAPAPPKSGESSGPSKSEPKRKSTGTGGSGGLATPAVRALLREHSIEIAEIEGTGKDGRVLKEDVLKHIEGGTQVPQPTQTGAAPAPKPELDAKQVETTQNLTAIQSAMFKSMTKSLAIPHFLYSDSVNVTGLAAMRSRLNATRDPETTPKFSYLPFIVKAVSMSLNRYPILNGRLDVSDTNRPKVMMRSNHNIGIAMDTPAGLLVPVIKNVNARSITSIAQEMQRLSQLGQAGKLSSNDLSGGTITVSNIGNIGGEVVAPVIVEGQLAILGIGKIRATPVFASDGKTIERADMMSTNWSADHRIIDGATMARIAKVVQTYLEQPETMLIQMS